jgi:hypothetical protein
MEPSHLTLDELKHELEIRAITFENEKQAIRSLRARLRQEIQDLSLRPMTSLSKPEEEIPICYAKMLELLEFLVVKVCVKDPRVRAQVYSRLCHLEKRVSRIDTHDVSQVEDLPLTLSALEEKILSIREKYFSDRAPYRPNITVSGHNNNNSNDDEELDSEDDDEISESEEATASSNKKPGTSNNRLRSSTPKPPTSHFKPAFPVHKWDLKFSGERKNFAVLDFIRKVKALAKAQKLSEKDLFDSSYHLFEGDGEL